MPKGQRVLTVGAVFVHMRLHDGNHCGLERVAIAGVATWFQTVEESAGHLLSA
jgi:hypothetical protein